MTFRLSPPRWPFLLAAALLCLIGCEKDEIRSYSVPRPEPETFEPKVRLLAVIAENGPDQWFFKLVGPTDQIGKHEKDFLGFIASLHFTDKKDKPVEWKKPSGWEDGPSGELRFATFYLGEKGKTPELTVFHFDQQSSVLANVNRWCERDLGRKTIRQADLDKFTKTIRVDGKEATLVDMTGPGPRGGAPMPPMAGIGGLNKPRPLPITYKTPDGWKETGPRMEGSGGIQVPILTAFQVGKPEKKTEATVTSMPDRGVPLLSQLNRWRGQVGLRSISQEDLERKPPEQIRVAGSEAVFLDLAGSEKRMLVVVARNGGAIWFLKLFGNPEVVDNNKSQFESFVKSVQFNGAPDE